MTEPTLHIDLFTVADRLEAELAGATDTDAWYTSVEIHLLAYRSVLASHSSDCAEDDLYHDVIASAPRVVPMLGRLRVECSKLDELAAFALASVHSPNRSAGGIRARVTDLLQLTNRHCSRSFALVHEAYAVDLGGQG